MIPLRVTMLYARDGDRWVPIFEHMSFGQIPAPRRDGTLYGTRIPSKVASYPDMVDELSSAMSPVLSLGKNRTAALATGPEAMLLGPNIDAEWHGLDMLRATILPGPARNVEDRRIGFVGRSVDKATIAYWIGNVVADIPAREGVKFLQDAELPIASVVASAAAESALDAEEETPAEPEVLKARKGDED